ncbi:HNH endonuclease [Gordonia phage Kuwabara]|nr:HNH endonuclease [Gordonia phage Kuwabara]
MTELRTRPPTGQPRWYPIPGFENYEISRFGHVRRGGRILKTFKMKSGHLSISLCVNGVRYQRQVHRLVLETFDGPAPEGMEALHFNGIPDDNRIENLRWGTRSANLRDAVRHGTYNNGHMRKTHCPQNHPYSEENTYRYRGRRHCKECSRARFRAYYAERKAKRNG